MLGDFNVENMEQWFPILINKKGVKKLQNTLILKYRQYMLYIVDKWRIFI